MHYKRTNELLGQENQKYGQSNRDLNDGCVSITFFSKNKDYLPVIKRVGDIIRVHRANIGQYKGFKTFYANIDFGTSWALFEGPTE